MSSRSIRRSSGSRTVASAVGALVLLGSVATAAAAAGRGVATPTPTPTSTVTGTVTPAPLTPTPTATPTVSGTLAPSPLTPTPTPCLPFCGDGVAECDEACDDGNTAPYDGCNELCQIECVEPTPRPTSDPVTDDDVSCQRVIAKETSKLVQARAKTLQKCHDSLLKGKLGPDPGPSVPGARLALCLADPKTQAKLARASSKVVAKIHDRCGGANDLCEDPPDSEEQDPNDIGFYGECPGLEGRGTCAGGSNDGSLCTATSDCTGGGVCMKCDWPIDDCGDVADCVECIGGVATSRSMLLYYDGLVASAVDEAAKCQRAIGKEAAKFLQAKEKSLQKCWDKALKGQHDDPCPDAGAAVDSVAYKAARKIARAESKAVAKLCRACGGADRRCDDDVPVVSALTPPVFGSGGGDDLTPAAIGFPASCDAVTVPGGPACGIEVDTLADLVFCVACVTEFKVDCVDASRMPALQGRVTPCQCNP